MYRLHRRLLCLAAGRPRGRAMARVCTNRRDFEVESTLTVERDRVPGVRGRRVA